MVKREIKIDVIVPVYNVQTYLAQCLQSLVEQTIPLKILIINDGSTDGSSIIAKEYAQKYDDVLYFEQENSGLSAARNKGLEYASSEYVAFMDSDDYVSKNFYEALLTAIKTENAEIACADITYLYQTKTMIKKSNTIKENVSFICSKNRKYHTYMKDIFPMAQNKLFRMSFLQQHHAKFLVGKYYEDLSFFYELYPKSKRIAFTAEGVFYYRQRKGSIVKSANAKNMDVMDVFTYLLVNYQKNEEDNHQYTDELNYLLIRNCLVASAKRLSFAADYDFIHQNLKKLFYFVESEVPQWRENKYLKDFTLRHVYLKTFYPFSLTAHSILLLLIGHVIRNKDEF
ncbi:MAG: glycosyltransferase family 2 protein [Culicoidibacterales bacterium]